MPSPQPLQPQGIPAIPCQGNNRKKLCGLRHFPAKISRKATRGIASRYIPRDKPKRETQAERTRERKGREGKGKEGKEGRKGFNALENLLPHPNKYPQQAGSSCHLPGQTFQGFSPASRRIAYTPAPKSVKKKVRDFETFIVTS